MDLSSYKNALASLYEAELKERRFNRLLFIAAVISFLVSLLILLSYGVAKLNNGLIEISDLVEVSLIPMFNFILASYQKNILDSQKAKMLQSMLESFETGQFQNADISIFEIRKLVTDLLTAKV